MFSFRLRETERLKVQFEESQDERTGDTTVASDLNQLTDDLVALKVTFSLYSLTSMGELYQVDELIRLSAEKMSVRKNVMRCAIHIRMCT